MLRPRIIPCLLIHDRGLVKTVKFSNPKYVGDPINAVRIFNEKHADEIMILDIDATEKRKEPDYVSIYRWAEECKMPLCYGGGIKTVEQAEKIISLGVEKVAISSEAIKNPSLIGKISKKIGSQSLVVVVDVKQIRRSSKYEIWINNGKINTRKSPVEFAQEAEKLGVGEIVVNSIDRDGMMNGFDLALAEQIRKLVSVPMTMIGGAGKVADIEELLNKIGICGAGIGSMFVFNGPYKAVLISYLSDETKEALFSKVQYL